MVRFAWIALLAPSLLMSQDTEDELKKKQGEIVAYLKTAKTEREFRAAVMDLAALGEKASAARKYDLAAKIYAEAERISRISLSDPGQAKSYQDAAKRMTDIGKEFQKAAKAMERIIAKEGTPEDYLASGKFLCFVAGDWTLGIEDLSKGKDAALQKLSQMDLAGAQDTDGMISIGDSWAARKEPGAKDRAVYGWYTKAWPLATGISREKLRSKLLAIVFRHGKVLGLPAGWSAFPGNVAIDETCSKVGARSLFIRPSGVHHYPKVRQPITAGRTYTVSAWVLTDGSDKGFPIVMLNYKEGTVEKGASITAPADQPWWVHIEKTITIPAGVEVSFACTGWYGAGKAWIDNLSVKSEDGVEFVADGDFEK